MTPSPPSPMPNLPPQQRFTQHIVDEFNRDEASWRKCIQEALATVRRHLKVLKQTDSATRETTQ